MPNVMEQNESFERMVEGLQRAASCCRELGKMTSIVSWGQLSAELLKMRDKGIQMYNGAPLTEAQVMGLVAKMEIAQLAAHYADGGR